MNNFNSTKLDKLSKVYEQIAFSYFQSGKTPEQVLAELKASGYKIIVNGTTYSVEATVVCNILRGIILTQNLVQHGAFKLTKTKGLHK